MNQTLILYTKDQILEEPIKEFAPLNTFDNEKIIEFIRDNLDESIAQICTKEISN